jgi:hypothetical protein
MYSPFTTPTRFRDYITEALSHGATEATAPEIAYESMRLSAEKTPVDWRTYDLGEACHAILGEGYKRVLGNLTRGAVQVQGETVRVMENAPVTQSAMQVLSDLSTFAMTAAARQGMEADTTRWSLINAIPNITITGAQADSGYRDATAFGLLIDDDRVNELESAHYAQQRAYAVNYPTFVGSHIAMGITEEMIEGDRTGEALRECYRIGQNMTRNQYNRVLGTLLGATARNTFAETIGTTRTPYNTYLTAGKWVNVISGNAVSDETQLQAIERTLAEQPHPINPQVFMSTPMRHVLCSTAKAYTLRRILNATEYRVDTGGDLTITTPLFSNAFQLFATPDLVPVARGTEGYGGFGATTVGSFSVANAQEIVIAGDFTRALTILSVPREMTKIVNDPNVDKRIVLGVHFKSRYEVCITSPRSLVFNCGTIA